MESFHIYCACYLSCVEISLNMNKLFLKFSKFKIKSDGFCCFHIGDNQDNFFLNFYLFIILLE